MTLDPRQKYTYPEETISSGKDPIRHDELGSEGALNDGDEIARLAYAIWEQRGCAAGNELDDWLGAERELARRRLSIR